MDDLDSVQVHDDLSVIISPSSYHIKFQSSQPQGSGGWYYIVQSDKVRSGVTDDVPEAKEKFKALKQARRERVQELLIQNTNWMKDVSRDDVDARKAAFKKDIEEPKIGTDDDEDDEMEM